MKTAVMAGIATLAIALAPNAAFSQTNLNTGVKGNINTSGNVRGNTVDGDVNAKSNTGVNKNNSGVGIDSNTNASGKIKVNPSR